MKLNELRALHFRDRHCVEVTDPVQARKFYESKCSCCWANGPIKGTEWSIVCQPSTQSRGDKRTVFVCKTALLEGACTLRSQTAAT